MALAGIVNAGAAMLGTILSAGWALARFTAGSALSVAEVTLLWGSIVAAGDFLRFGWMTAHTGSLAVRASVGAVQAALAAAIVVCRMLVYVGACAGEVAIRLQPLQQDMTHKGGYLLRQLWAYALTELHILWDGPYGVAVRSYISPGLLRAQEPGELEVFVEMVRSESEGSVKSKASGSGRGDQPEEGGTDPASSRGSEGLRPRAAESDEESIP